MAFKSQLSGLLAFEGVLRAGVYEGLNTHDLYSALYNAMHEATGTVVPINLQDFNLLRSILVRQRTAQRVLSSASDSTPIGDSMIATNSITRSQTAQRAAPLYLVRFEHNYIEDGQEQTNWRSMLLRQAPPAYVGDLREAANVFGDYLSSDYEVEHVGIGEMAILAM